MAEVGRLFNNNELIVAEVLQSAEAMKAAVNHLEQFMEKAETAARGKMMLATVKGDVHDIGKNLVEIILANNGYKVVNLGIKVPPGTLISAYHEHKPDAIGLSGLLVKSTQQMVITASDLQDRGHRRAAAGGRRGAFGKIHPHAKSRPAYGEAVCYAKDAMTGLSLMNRLMDPADARRLSWSSHRSREDARAGSLSRRSACCVRDHRAQPQGAHRYSRFPPRPYLDRKVRDVPHLAEVWSYINPYMLYGRHLGYKGNFEKVWREHDAESAGAVPPDGRGEAGAARLHEGESRVAVLRSRARRQLDPPVRARRATPLHTFRFGRQRREDGLCLSDYILDPERRPPRSPGDVRGDGRRVHPRTRPRSGRRPASSSRRTAIQALAIETAEGCAEWLHRRIREDWGFPDPPTMTMQERFTSRYRGKRYSFGYPACPNLDDQQGMWKLLRPDEIGVRLTEGMMMEPEASVSALVFHHPDCAYFTADESEAVTSL